MFDSKIAENYIQEQLFTTKMLICYTKSDSSGALTLITTLLNPSGSFVCNILGPQL